MQIYLQPFFSAAHSPEISRRHPPAFRCLLPT